MSFHRKIDQNRGNLSMLYKLAIPIFDHESPCFSYIKCPGYYP